MAATLVSKLLTLLKSTLVSIQAFLLWLFVCTPVAALHAVTPYPLRPDLEGKVLDITLDSVEAQDLEDSNVVPRVATQDSTRGPARRRASSAPIVRESVVAVDPQDIPPSRDSKSILPLYHSRRPSDAVLHLKAAPLSVVTNVAFTSPMWAFAQRPSLVPPPPKSKSVSFKTRNAKDKENLSKQSQRKPLPFKPASRYLDLVANSQVVSTSSTSVTASGPSLGLGNYSYPRRRSIVGRSGSIDAGELATKSSEEEDDVVDFAARVRSVFYGCRALDGDDCDVREVFKRDSFFGCGVHGLEGEADIAELVNKNSRCIKPRPPPTSATLSYDDACDASFNTISVADGSFAFSTTSSDSSSSIDSPEPSLSLPAGKLARLTPSSVLLHQLQTSSSSELPYLSAGSAGNRNSSASLACELSMSATTNASDASAAAVFSDLLASLERKFPGTEWTDIVRFEDLVKQIGMKDPREERDRDREDTQEDEWSDVLSLADYVV
ncbi:hypothetical protein C8F01DRAFT_1366454 [Mycena amicta]|nr:hypothetical protein C8F01DRAFT_1366454 [Mycena amicta]